MKRLHFYWEMCTQEVSYNWRTRLEFRETWSEILWNKQGDYALQSQTRDLPETCRPWIFRLPRKRLIHKFSWLDSRRNTSRTCSSKRFPTTATFQCCITSVKTEVCSRSTNPSDSMLWIEEVEVASCVDDLRTSRSMFVNPFQNFETLHAKIASSLMKILQNSHFRKSVQTDFSVEGRLWKNDLHILSGDWSTGGCSWFFLIYSVSLYMAYDIQNFDTRWDQALLSTSEVPNDKIMESLFNMRIRGSDQTERHNTQPS